MTHLRRTWAALLAVPLLAVAGCGGAGPATGGWAETGEITYWMWDAAQLPAYQQCADDFEAAHPDIDITIEQVGWDDYWNRLLTSFVSNAAPDVFVDHTGRYGQYVDRQLIEPLDALVERDGPDLDQYVEGTARLWVGADGQRYGLPKDFDAVGIFYDAAQLSAAGVDPAVMDELTWNPQDGGTYEDLIARLTVDRNGVRGDEPGFDPRAVATYGLGLEDDTGSAYGQTQWSMYALSTGWRHTDEELWGTRYQFDDPRFQETIDWWRGLIEKGFMPPLAVTAGGSVDQGLQAGRYAMIVQGSWNINNLSRLQGVDLAVAPTPIGPTGQRATLFNSLADSISRGSSNKGAAWRWVRHLASPECQSIVARGGVVLPAIASEVPAAEARLGETGLDVTAFTRQIRERTFSLFPITAHSADIDAIMSVTMDRVVNGADLTAFDTANAEVNALFTRRP